MNNLTIIFGLLLTFLAQNLWAEDEISHHHIDRTGQTIYSYENELPIKHNRKSETVGPVEINKIEVVKETSDQLEFSVTYTYNFEVPVEQVRIFIGAGMEYFRASYKQVQKLPFTSFSRTR